MDPPTEVNMRVLCSHQDEERILDCVNTEYVMQYLLICAPLCLQQVYKWTGDNMFFIKGDMDSLAFGGGR